MRLGKQTIANSLFATFFLLSAILGAQITERPRPAEWNDLIVGGRFMDRFLPISPQGPLTDDTWGAPNVVPRYVDNGIEAAEWSYWGGNTLLGDDGKYHLFVCRWREDAEKGHGEWPNSIVVRAVSDTPYGPYKVAETIGPGHNPEAFRLADGRYVVYVINGRYVANSMEGPWEYGKFEFETRDRPIIEGLSNLSFAQREDGSYIMVCRGGGIWFSKDGLSPYNQVTDQRVYPPVEGHFEDPVIWRTHIQYHMIVNDWLGRIAYYLRSKDGIHWKVDPGEAYLPGIARYTDGTNEDWFKYERIKVLQDSLGRAIQAQFAVIDVLKKEDKGSDNHSSKHITIPLAVGKQIVLLNKKAPTEHTEEIKLLVKAEPGFDPHKDIDLSTLRYGAPEEVNFGRGSTVVGTERQGKDLLISFTGTGNGIGPENFVGKLLGKDSQGQLLFGYSRLPWVSYLEPALSARLPVFDRSGNTVSVEVQNFGQIGSSKTKCTIAVKGNEGYTEVATTTVKKLAPFEKNEIQIPLKKKVALGEQWVRVTLYPKGQDPIVFEQQLQLK